MYKLLVVDDEPRQVKALANIINQLRPDYEVFTAEDGQAAIEFMRCNKIDILFTDIKMPNMDGLQLVEKVNGLGTAVKTVILSGYGEFEYAQKAMRFKVYDYLVKPVSKSDLQNILVKVENSLKQEQVEKSQKEDFKKKLDNSLPVYLSHQLNKWVAGNLNKLEIEEINDIFLNKGSGVVIITCFSESENIKNGLSSEFIAHVTFSIKKYLHPIGHAISFFLEKDKNMMVTILNTENSQFNLQASDNIKILNEYKNCINDEFGINATIGISEKSDNIFESIKESFKKACSAIEYRFFVGIGKIIFYSSNTDLLGVKLFNINANEAEISEAVRRADKIALSKSVSKIFECINENCRINPNQFKEDCLHLLLNQAKLVSSLVMEEQYNILILNIKTNVLQCEEYKSLWHFMNQTLYDIADILNNNSNEKNRVIFEKCKKYIEENYMEEISLETISQKYYFNSSYFSKLFKNYTGLGFAEYLLKIRIKKAEQLLKNSTDNMSDVAKKVGFNDPTYFNRMFKREVGISPLKYRQTNER